MAGLDELGNERRADEAGGAGQKDTHAKSPAQLPAQYPRSIIPLK
jgi:hypothetical protein